MFKMVASRQLKDANINRLQHELSLIDWSDINNLTNANQAYDCFLSKFNPLTAVSRGSGYKLFVTRYRPPVFRIEHYMQKRAVSRCYG